MENQIRLFTVQDLWDERDKQTPVDLTKKYDPLHFWDDYGDRYAKGFDKPQEVQRNVAWIVFRMKSLGVESLLDVGCGFGRLEPFLIDGEAVKKITAIDISQKQLDSANKYLENYPQKDKITFVKESIKRTSFEANSFDCILSSECLMHQTYNKANLGIREMQRLTKKYIILVERFVYNGEHLYPHIWSHDYFKLVSNCGLTILENKAIGGGFIGMILKK